ncbi:protoporphyrinogen/coproporphyrinogen oxidase [Alteromonas oceani]|uniref:Protoporphyrinogen/coproporphyrinogen oxidase n=1 Tax=Alteromonas oceani TaxID=2071609 RepID=A0ABV7JWR1_9ALTE|nr:NAD(P)-binding protein [Alteromonas oceani]
MKIKVVGSGVSGLAIANMLSSKGAEVQVLEKNSKVGGLIACDIESGFLYHKVGGHVFNSRNNDVLDWFWSFFDKDSDFVKVKRNAKILLMGKLIGYPIENNLYQLSKGVVRQIFEELLRDKRGDSNCINFKEYLLNTFGQTLCEIYFFPYNQKIWQCDLEKVSLDWLEGKLPMPNLGSIILDNIFREEEAEMVHSTFYYPKVGGSQFIADTLAENLNVKYNVLVDKIEFYDGALMVNGESVDKLIYTGRVTDLQNIFFSDDEDIVNSLASVSNLNFHGTSNLLCECDFTDISWLYLPEDNVKAHRIIYTGGFSKSNNGSSKRMSCTVEFSGELTFDEMVSELENLPGNLVPIASNNEIYSYVIQDQFTRDKISKIKYELAKANIYLLGRFAEWEYFNMDAAIESAMRLSQKITLDH